MNMDGTGDGPFVGKAFWRVGTGQSLSLCVSAGELLYGLCVSCQPPVPTLAAWHAFLLLLPARRGNPPQWSSRR